MDAQEHENTGQTSHTNAYPPSVFCQARLRPEPETGDT